ncbi:MAG: DUF3883 domain-containing protein [Leptolyngbyaceae bacterium]|nr:DUF3883 domain-containing protein [Leptolyngbyaceae bacterium]
MAEVIRHESTETSPLGKGVVKRPVAELLVFLTETMSMVAVYQPVVILHLLTREGLSSRGELARTLSGYDDSDLSEWDRILMKNPKQVLVGTHEILNYDAAVQTFALNFDLRDDEGVKAAIALCETKITEWIGRAIDRGTLTDAEILRLYRVLEAARRGDAYGVPEVDFAIEEFALLTAVQTLHQRYPQAKITQQPYDTLGYAVLVGTPQQPVAYVNVKATAKPVPCFALSEGERQFALDHAAQFLLVVVYAINLVAETYQIALHQGPLTASNTILLPTQWKATLLDTG